MKKKNERRVITCKLCGKLPIETEATAYICWRCTMHQPERTVAEIDAIDDAIEKRNSKKEHIESPQIEESDVDTQTIETQTTVAKKTACPECGGPAKGRGFSHNETCSLKTKVSIVPAGPKPAVCPVCGGPPYKRGYKHSDDCSNSTVNKLKAKTTK